MYDYYNFPQEAYNIKYDAPGSPALAQRVAELLKLSGLSCNLEAKRGWDHGVFVPLKLLYPAADIPVVEMSVLKSLDAEVGCTTPAGKSGTSDEMLCAFHWQMCNCLVQSFAVLLMLM